MTAAVLIGLMLLAVVAGGLATTPVLTVLFIALSATVGLILPNIAPLAFGHVRE